MMEFLVSWASLGAYFLITGAVLSAAKKTVGARAGDHGFKGFFYVWKRVLVLPIGAAIGAAGAALGVPVNAALGDGVGGGILAGVLGAALAGFLYGQVIGLVKARVRHLSARGDGK